MVMQDIKLAKEKHAPASRAISMAMWVRRYEPRLKPKSTANFLAIKRYQQTKSLKLLSCNEARFKVCGHDRQ